MATGEDKTAKQRAKLEKAEALFKRRRAEFLQAERQKKLKDAAQQRKDDTRRKILVGSMYLDRGEKDADQKARTLKRLNEFLQRTDDRALFGLPPLPSATKPPESDKPAE
jgi:hypothetical protein